MSLSIRQEEGFTMCLNCGNIYSQGSINEYGLCPDCEQELQDEKQSILETQQSLNKQF